ncbi:penicillin-binding protein [Dactylosporangium sp. NBC_01737]|uniref:transglycosylase domain-containing protein n=1 Tax=Dactylosporangium sp. NBC_01737 TaxID=2975959 RepID=UPI002E11AFF4|nr:penicillin-binding protein [Dactylosporangium sp. NBC_01737]
MDEGDDLNSPPPPAGAAGDAPAGPTAKPEASGDVPAEAATGARRGRGRKILVRSLVALVVVAALCAVGGTYYFDQVALPEDLSLEQSTTIYYADGTTPMARIGDKNRTVLTIDQIPVDVQHAVVAAQDDTFYTNNGVDYGDAVGAAWNHVTGDGRRGASTISQQYARQWAELEGASYSRKLRESVIAIKLNDEYTKDQILAMYLNIIYFGRGAYGIQAAALAYFGKPAKDLTLAEGIVLAGLIDNPEGNSGKGSPFDPTVDAQQAHARFDEIKRQMIAMHFVTPEDADQKTAYPAKVLTAAEARANAVNVQGGMDKPEGLIVHHVLAEVAALTDPKTGQRLYEGTAPDGVKHFDAIRNGGLKIVTTIDRTVQQIAVREASRNAESNMGQQPANLQAALVAVEPGTGAVKAYYGGDSGNAGDYAGYHRDPVLGTGEESCCGGHPGAPFSVYTLATALMDGYSTDSYWNGESPQDFPGSGRSIKMNNPVRNVGETTAAAPQCRSGSPKWCTLDEVAVMSLTAPLFGVAEKVGPAKVIDTARAAGITEMWATVDGKVQKVDVAGNNGQAVFPKYFNTEVAIGQYPVTVLDQAAGMATFAARGLAARTHFLKEVWTNGKKTWTEVVAPKRIPGFTEQMADDLNGVLQAVPQHYGLKMHDDRQVAGAAASWQLGPTTANAHAWMVGYNAYDPADKSNGLAVAVWVGNKAQEQAIVDSSGRSIIGGTLPGTIWRDFLDDALTALKAPPAVFPAKQGTGDKKVGTGISPGP